MSIQVPNRGVLAIAIASAVTTFAPPKAVAQATQDSSSAGGLEEVVVMARKRAENLQEVPVSLTALTSNDIVRLDLTSLEKVAAATPNFSVGRASSGSGAQLTLRGIGSSSTSIGLEQSVAVIVDGAYYGQGRIIQEGFFDLERIEILKGPQALFFGKNATAGVIALQTANPTDEWEFTARTRYEFESEQTQLEAIASGPLTDTLGLRVALRGSKMSGGYYKNVANDHAYSTFDIATNQLTTHTAEAAERDAPGEEEALGRVTLRWTPTDRLTATLKVAGDYNDVNNSSWNYVITECDGGVSTLNPDYPCRRDFVTHQNGLPATIARDFPAARNNGELYNRYESYAVTATIDYELDDILVTWVNNYNRNRNQWTCDCDFQSSENGTWATEDSTWRALSSELRVLTEFDSAVNGMLGVYLQKTKRDFDQWVTFFNLEDSSVSPELRYVASSKDSYTDGETIAAFGQLIWTINDQLEAAAGVRYTHETKDSMHQQPYNNAALAGFFRSPDTADGLGVVTADQSFDNWSPEATLTWKPTGRLMVYGAYKTAYKSGGFSNSGINSALSTDPTADLTFDPEEAEGFEIGVKSTLLGGQLTFNVGVYQYDYEDLQVDFFNSPIFAYQTVTGDAQTQGVEMEVRYAPLRIDGLLLRGSANYNEAKYTRFDGPCYAGQTPAQGCTLIGPSGAPFQDLDDTELSVAPKWTAALGGDYETRFGNGLRFGVSLDARYSSDYLSSAFGLAATRQDSYVELSASIRLGRDDDRWEVALLGRNLTDEFYVTGSNDGPSTGSGTGTPAGVLADQASYAALPRTVQAQLTVRF